MGRVSSVTHVDDLIFTGGSNYIHEIFVPKMQGKFDTCVSKEQDWEDWWWIQFPEENVQNRSCWPLDPTRQLHPADVESLSRADGSGQTSTTTGRQLNLDGRQVRTLAWAREDWPFQKHCWTRYLPMSREIWWSIFSEGIDFKNAASYSYIISSVEEILGVLEEDYGLLSSTSAR